MAVEGAPQAMLSELSTRLGMVVLAVAGVGAIVMPLLASEPLAWSMLLLVTIALAAILMDWRARLVTIPTVVAGSTATLLGAGVPTAEVLTVVGMAVFAWLLVSALRASVRRGIDAAVAQRRRAERTRDVLSMMSEMVSLDPSRTIERVATALVNLGYPIVAVSELSGRYLHDIEVRGVPDGVTLRPLSIGEGALGRAVADGTLLFIEDYAAFEHRTPQAPPIPIGATMAAPILLGGEPVGGLLAGRHEPGAISEEDRRFFHALAVQAARALDVARRFRSEQQIAERLAELERLKFQFLRSITADLRGPLSVIRGLTYTLKDQQDSLSEAESQETMERITLSVERLNRMVETLLDFSRVRGYRAGSAKTVPLARLAEEVAAAARSSYPHHSVSAATHGICTVDGDPELLEQALMHLVDNACRHTPAGTHVMVRVEGAAGTVAVEVADDGPGLPAGLANAIENGDVTELQGALGFTLVSHILTAHGSSLEVLPREHGTALGFHMSEATTGLALPPRTRVKR